MQSIGNFDYHNQVKHGTNRIANESSLQRQLYIVFKLNTCGVSFAFCFLLIVLKMESPPQTEYMLFQYLLGSLYNHHVSHINTSQSFKV